MTQRTGLEAVFVAADAPKDAARTLTGGLSTGEVRPGPDGQELVEGLGVFLAMEPSNEESPAGTVTLWFRVPDVAATVDALRDGGAEILSPPTPAGEETVATVRLPQGLRVGVIA